MNLLVWLHCLVFNSPLVRINGESQRYCFHCCYGWYRPQTFWRCE